jgi:hypothetical protein
MEDEHGAMLVIDHIVNDEWRYDPQPEGLPLTQILKGLAKLRVDAQACFNRFNRG